VFTDLKIGPEKKFGGACTLQLKRSNISLTQCWFEIYLKAAKYETSTIKIGNE